MLEQEHPDRSDSLVDLRMQRQELLTRAEPPSLHFILDEAVIRREIGGKAVTRRQLKQLVELAQLPNVTIRIVPFSHGMYPRMRGPYIHFEFPDPVDEDILYLETPDYETIIREGSADPQELVNPIRFLEIFWQLEQVAHRDDFVPTIERRLAELEREG
jgi:hypothetical protein